VQPRENRIPAGTRPPCQYANGRELAPVEHPQRASERMLALQRFWKRRPKADRNNASTRSMTSSHNRGPRGGILMDDERRGIDCVVIAANCRTPIAKTEPRVQPSSMPSVNTPVPDRTRSRHEPTPQSTTRPGCRNEPWLLVRMFRRRWVFAENFSGTSRRAVVSSAGFPVDPRRLRSNSVAWKCSSLVCVKPDASDNEVDVPSGSRLRLFIRYSGPKTSRKSFVFSRTIIGFAILRAQDPILRERQSRKQRATFEELVVAYALRRSDQMVGTLRKPA